MVTLFSKSRSQRRLWIDRTAQLMLVVVLATAMFLPTPRTAHAFVVPTFTVSSVTVDSSVTIITNNFPAGQDFTVRMGAYGTLGVGGYVVGTFNSGAGGSFSATFAIPAALAGSYQIAIRMDSAAGYYSYNWFYNNSFAGPAVVGYTGIPTFSIVSVVTDTSVTVQTNNLPPSQDFTVRMGAYGTYAIGGTVVDTFSSGVGGAQTLTFTIPAGLAGSYQVAIRMDSPAGYYAYNWFYNNTASPPPVTPPPGYAGFPTFSISSVTADSEVTVLTNNLPPSQDFTVRMGAYGSYAIGGTVVATFSSGAGGAQSFTFPIPAGLAGSYQIALRMDCPAGYYAYNWFFNNTTGGTPPPPSGYTGFPTFSVSAVVQNTSVTVQAYNLPPSQDFSVRMGGYGTYAIGGVEVATFNSGAGGNQSFTFNVPASLAGSFQIAVRMDSTAGFYAYNWFYNNTYP